MGSSHRACFFCKFSNTWWGFCPPAFAFSTKSTTTYRFSLITYHLIHTPCYGFCTPTFVLSYQLNGTKFSIFHTRGGVLHYFFTKPNRNLSLLTHHLSLNPPWCIFACFSILVFCINPHKTLVSHFFCLRLAKHCQKLAKICFLIYTVYL